MVDINFSDQLKSDPSRANIDFVSYIIGNDADAFRQVFELIYNSPHPINQRAAGVIETVTRENPFLIYEYIDKMIETVTEFKVDGVKRNFIKIFTRIEFTDIQMGKLIVLCFDYLSNNKESIAVRVFSMEVLYNISKSYPEIKTELILSIEHGMHSGIPAFIARGTMILKKLYKEVG